LRLWGNPQACLFEYGFHISSYKNTHIRTHCVRVCVCMHGGHWVIGMCEEKKKYERKKKGGKRDIERFFSLYFFSHLFSFFFFLYVLRHSKSIKDHVTCNWKKIAIMFHIILFSLPVFFEKIQREKRKDNGWEQNIKRLNWWKEAEEKKRDEEVAKESCKKKKNGTVFSEDKTLFSPCAICRHLLVSLLRKKTFFLLLSFPFFSLFFSLLLLSMRDREREAPCSLIVLLCESSFFSPHGGGKEVWPLPLYHLLLLLLCNRFFSLRTWSRWWKNLWKLYYALYYFRFVHLPKGKEEGKEGKGNFSFPSF
jgi:hypothetical protein